MTSSDTAWRQQAVPVAPVHVSQQQNQTSADDTVHACSDRTEVRDHRTAGNTGPDEVPITQQDSAPESTAGVADAVWPRALPTRDSLERSLSIGDLPAVVLQPQRKGFQGGDCGAPASHLDSSQLLLPAADRGYEAHTGGAAAAGQFCGYDEQLADQHGAALASRGSRLPTLSALEASAFSVKHSRQPFRAPAMYLTQSGR